MPLSISIFHVGELYNRNLQNSVAEKIDSEIALDRGASNP